MSWSFVSAHAVTLDHLAQNVFGRFNVGLGQEFVRLVGLVDTTRAKDDSFHTQRLQEVPFGAKGDRTWCVT